VLIFISAPSPIPSQIPHTLFHSVWMQFNVVTRTPCKTVHTCARSKMPQHNIVNIFYSFSHDWFQGKSMCIDRRQSTQLCPYHMRFYYNYLSWLSHNVLLCIAFTLIINSGTFKGQCTLLVDGLCTNSMVCHVNITRQYIGTTPSITYFDCSVDWITHTMTMKTHT